MSHNYKIFSPLSFCVIFWQSWQFSFILLEVFSTLHSCLFNMSLVAQQIIVSQSEYLPSFWSSIPFSSSSTLAVSSEQRSILIFLYFGHSVTLELLLMFFLPLFFLSHQILNIIITPFCWEALRFLFVRLQWPNGKFPSPSPEAADCHKNNSGLFYYTPSPATSRTN